MPSKVRKRLELRPDQVEKLSEGPAEQLARERREAARSRRVAAALYAEWALEELDPTYRSIHAANAALFRRLAETPDKPIQEEPLR